MPEVTVALRPYGEPTATTVWPTLSPPDLPSAAGTRSSTPLTLITAMSVIGSVPTTVAFLVVPSLKFTVIDPLSPTPATTWLLVRMLPSLLSTMPEPDPAPDWPVTLTLTTEGSTALATFSTVPSCDGGGLGGLERRQRCSSGCWSPPSSLKAWKAAAPPTPAAPPSTSAPTRTAAVSPRAMCRAAAGAVCVPVLPGVP